MTGLSEAAQQAMDILDSEFTTVNGEFCRWCDGHLNEKHNCKLEQAITALRAALAEPVQDGTCKYCTNGCPACDARKQRKPLTEEEIEELIDSVDGLGVGRQVMRKVARAIERAHRIE